MAKRKTAARKSGWQALSSRLMKQYGGPRGMQMAAAEWKRKKGGASSNAPKRRKAAKRRVKNPGKAAANPYFRYKVPGSVVANPYSRYQVPASVSYNPWVKKHKRKTAKVRRHYRKAAKNPGRRNSYRYKVGSAVANYTSPEGSFESRTAASGIGSPIPRTASPMQARAGQSLEFLKAFATKEFIIDTFLPLTVGFAGTKMVWGMLTKSQQPKPEDTAEQIAKKRARLVTLEKYRPGLYAGGGIAIGLTTGLLFKNVKWAAGIATGGLFAAVQSILERYEFYRAWFSLPPLEMTQEGLGSLSTTAKDKIARLVEAEVAREAASMSGMRGMDAYVTESDIRTPAGGAMAGVGMDAFATESDLRQPRTGPGASGVAGVSMDEFLAGPDMGL